MTGTFQRVNKLKRINDFFWWKARLLSHHKACHRLIFSFLQYGGGIALRCPIKNPRLPFHVFITIIIPWLILKGKISRGSITILFVVQCKETLPLTVLREGLNTVPGDLYFCIHHIVGCVLVQTEYEALSNPAVHWLVCPQQRAGGWHLGQLDCHWVTLVCCPVMRQINVSFLR